MLERHQTKTKPSTLPSLLICVAALSMPGLDASAQTTQPTTQPTTPMEHMDHASHSAQAPVAIHSGAQELTTGEVTRWSESTGKVTIRHAEIKNLDMPPMTMVFALKEPARGASLKTGDKVLFHAERSSGALVITHIEIVADHDH